MITVTDYELISNRDDTPLTIDEVREYLKLGDSCSDTEIRVLIDTVTIKAEQITGRDLINKTYKGYLDYFPNGLCPPYYYNNSGIKIQKSKLQSITSIEYLKDNVLTPFDPSKYYFTKKQEFSSIYLINGESWPADADRRKQAVEITFIAGYGDEACSIPSDLKSAMLRHIALLYESRGDCGDESSMSNLVLGLYMPYIVSKKFFCAI